MRQAAIDRGLRLNEFGLFPEKEAGGKIGIAAAKHTLECKNESEIYRILDMEFVPPELREDMGEIEAATDRPARLRCAFGVGEISEQRDDGVVVVELPYGVLYLSAADAFGKGDLKKKEFSVYIDKINFSLLTQNKSYFDFEDNYYIYDLRHEN